MIRRDGKQIQRIVEIGAARAPLARAEDLAKLLDGLRIDNNPDGDGVLVVAVAPNSAATYSDLRPGDVSVGANKRCVRDIDSFRAALELSKTSIPLHVEHNGGFLFIAIRQVVSAAARTARGSIPVTCRIIPTQMNEYCLNRVSNEPEFQQSARRERNYYRE